MRWPGMIFFALSLVRADAGYPQGELPQQVAQCVSTTISAIYPRVGTDPWTDEEFDWGTAVEFSNGGYQVSYEREPAVLSSRPGDEVLMCLVFIPGDCPPGDDRGREYRTTNKRTGESWELPDSQHYCGGA